MKPELLFLGTAAADQLPNPFCDCPICEDARSDRKKHRLRSCFLLDEETLIDCGPDLGGACMRHSVKLTKLRRVFVTHTHEDHFSPENIGLISMSRTHGNRPVDVYLSAAAYDAMCHKASLLSERFSHLDSLNGLSKELVRLHPLNTFQTVTVDGYSVMPVRTTHRIGSFETAVNYLVETPYGLKILYACDTGIYPQDTLQALKGAAVDLLIMEGTFGSRTDTDTASHLTATAYVQMLRLLEANGVLRPDTKVYLTHINHKHTFTHEKYQRWMDEHAKRSVTVARDGQRIE